MFLSAIEPQRRATANISAGPNWIRHRRWRLVLEPAPVLVSLDRLASECHPSRIDRDQLQEAVPRRTKGEHTLATFKARDSQRQGWIKALLAGELPRKHPPA
jgi:hypothetical protein